MHLCIRQMHSNKSGAVETDGEVGAVLGPLSTTLLQSTVRRTLLRTSWVSLVTQFENILTKILSMTKLYTAPPNSFSTRSQFLDLHVHLCLVQF